MNTNLGALVMKLVLEARQFRQDLDQQTAQTEAAVGKLEKSTTSMGAAVKGIVEGQSTAAASASRALAVLGPVGAAAAVAVGAVTVAYIQGAKEARAYESALILTGNVAGTTAGQMADMAKAVGQVVGTQGQAAATLAQLAGSARVQGQDLQKFAATANEMERTVGTAVGDTVKHFAELGDAPVKASVKLNEAMNYLTAATYDQIKAAQDLGDQERAASIAQNAYADAMAERTKRIKDNLGFLQTAWNEVRLIADRAWDAMLNVGRPDTMADQIANVRQKIADAQGQNPNRPFSLPWDTPLADLKQQLSFLTEQERMIKRGTEAEAERARVNKLYIQYDQEGDAFKTKAAKRDEAIAKAQTEGQQLVNAGLITEEQLRARLADINAKYDTKSPSGAVANESEVAAIRAKTVEQEKYLALLKSDGADAQKMTEGEQLVIRIQQQLQTSISGVARAEKEKALAAAQSLALVDRQVASEQARQKALKAEEAALNSQVDAVRKQADSINGQASAQDAVNANYGKSKTAIEQATLALMQQQAAEAESSDQFAPAYVAALEKKIAAQQRWVATLQDTEYLQANRKLDESARASAEEAKSLELQVSLIGQSQQEREKIIAQRKVEVDLAKQLAEIERLNLGSGPEAEAKRIELRNKAIQNSFINSNNAANKAMVDESQRTADSINGSLTDALLRGFESGKGFAMNLRDTVVNMFKTMVLRPVISFILNPISMALGGLFGGMGGAMAGQGGGSGILGMAANGASLYNGLSSGTGMLGTVGNWLGLGAAGGAVGAGAWGSAAVAGSYAAPGIGAVGSLGGAAAGASTGIMGALGAIPGWGWALAGLALLPSLFGHTLKDSGIQGTFGGDKGFEGHTYKYYEGGLFSSDKTDIGALDETVRKTLGDTFNAMKVQVTDFATALGLSTDKLKGFTSDVKISLKGLSDADAQKKIQDALATANNDLAQQVIGTWVTTTQDVVRQVQATAAEMEAGSSSTNSVTSSETTSVYKPSEFAHEGEKAIDTLKRLATSLELANTWLGRFGASLFDASLAGGSQASDFIDKTGGQDAFNSQASSYFNNYYTSAQKYQAAQDEIAKKLNDAGIAMPHTAAEFKAAMDQFLAMGVAGQDGAAALLAVNDAFAQIHGTIGQLEQAMGVSADSLKGILDDVRKNATSAADAKKMASQKFEDSIYTGLGNAMTQGLSQMIMNAVVGPLVNGLLAGATGSAAALTAGGVAGGTSSAAGGAAAGGAVASGGAAAGAAMAQGGAMAGAAVASTIDQARTYMAGFAAIMADPTVRDTISQIAAGFGDIAASMPGLTGGASSASSAMSSAGSSAGSMGDAVSQLGDTLDAEVKRLRGMMVEDSPSKGRDFLLADFTTTTAAARAGDQTALARLPELSQQLEAATKLTAGSSVELARMRGWLAGSLVETQSKFAVQTDAQWRAQMAAMNPPGYDLRDTPRYADTWSATPIYTPWEEPTADSRYADSWSTTPLPGTGNLRGQDPNMAPDWRYTGGGIGAGMYDARSPDYRPDWRYNDSWSADPHLINPRPSWYGPSYEIGTNYVPKTGLAMLHEGEEVTPKAWNPAAGGRDGWREVVSELQAMRRDIQTLQQPDQQAHQKDVKRLGERLLRVVERMDGAGIAVRAEGALV